MRGGSDSFPLRRFCLAGGKGERTRTGWAVLAYNVETDALYA
jgi:hypothetical protein